jgi:uncharacterized protein YijF (DUF1287 family)
MEKPLRALRFAACVVLLASCACASRPTASQAARGNVPIDASVPQKRPSSGSPFLDKLVEAAIARSQEKVRYDATYFKIDYPNGDIPAEVGVCTDEIIRSYRKVGVDLQKEVHEDMKSNFSVYPKKWGLKKPDTNIDHRRVPNLMVFFERQGSSLAITDQAVDYKPGDVVTWDLGNGLTHIGIVVNIPSEYDENRLLIEHNIGAGPQIEDILFNWKVTGHYRYMGPKLEQPKPSLEKRPLR